MKFGIVIAGGTALLLNLAGTLALQYLARREVQARIGPRHVYNLSERPKALTEDMALAKARESLVQDGLDISSWSEYGGARQVTSNRAVFMFTNGASSTRFVHVDLDGNRLVCQTSVGK